MIYEIICNETGERFISLTELEKPDLKSKIKSNEGKFTINKDFDNTYSLNLLENCFNKIGLSPTLYPRYQHYLRTLPNINTTNLKRIPKPKRIPKQKPIIQEINENSLIYKKN